MKPTPLSPAPHFRELPTSLSLVAGLRRQDARAWHDFVALYTPLVVRWCHRQGLDEADIADLAQEVFCKVVQYVGRFRMETPTDSFRGWLCRITHRELADFFRQRAARAQAAGGSGPLEQLHQHPAPLVPEPDAEEVRGETRLLYDSAVQTARSEFSDATWTMFWRVAVDGNPAPRIAEEMSTTPAAVRQAKSRVLRRLKQLVGDLDD